MSSESPKISYKTLDAWRGVASLWVVMYHMTLDQLERYPKLRGFPIYAINAWGKLGVQMFFVISGFCIANAAVAALRRPQSFKSFMIARIRRIYPPCWFALLIAAVFAILMTRLTEMGVIKSSVLGQQNILHQGPLYFFGNLTLTAIFLKQPLLLVVCWTLTYEVCFYVIVGLALLFQAQLRGGRGMLNALHFVTVAMMCVLLFKPEFRRYPLDLWPQFGLGILVYDVLQYWNEARPKIWAAIAGLQFLAFGIFFDLPIGAWPSSSRVTFLLCLGFAILLVALYRYDAPLARLKVVQWLSWIGLFSYSLYLTHVLVLGVFNQAVKRAHPPERLHAVIFTLAVCVSVAAGRLFYQYFEKPFAKSARKPAVEPVPAQQLVTETT